MQKRVKLSICEDLIVNSLLISSISCFTFFLASDILIPGKQREHPRVHKQKQYPKLIIMKQGQ